MSANVFCIYKEQREESHVHAAQNISKRCSCLGFRLNLDLMETEKQVILISYQQCNLTIRF